MNAYRVALIFCRAVAISLWWNAGIGLLSGVVMALITRAGWFGTGVPFRIISNGSWIFPLGYFVFAALIAIFLRVFAPSLSAAATGGAMFEGESLDSRGGLQPSEAAMARIGAGLIILFSALAGFLPSVVWAAYELFGQTSALAASATIARSLAIHSLVTIFIPSALRGLVGFVLAFRLGLRRLVETVEQETKI